LQRRRLRLPRPPPSSANLTLINITIIGITAITFTTTIPGDTTRQIAIAAETGYVAAN
jgi:hypothetical protein